MAAGKTNAEIAEAIWIGPGTVGKHLENIYEKLGVHSRTAAVATLQTANSCIWFSTFAAPPPNKG